jgi:Nif-specific regulatory protein
MVLAKYKTKEAIMSSLKEQIREIEKEEIIKALQECEWVMARAARKLGITERMIGYKIKKYGIRREAEEVRSKQ